MEQEPFPHNGQDIINDLEDKLDLLEDWEENVLKFEDINGLRYPDQGVKHELRSAYQFVMNAHNDRARAVETKVCHEKQIRILEQYKEACRRWKERNDEWLAAFQNKENDADLEQRKGQLRQSFNQLQQQIGPQQQQGLRVGHVNVNSLQTLDDDGEPHKFDNLRAYIGLFNFHIVVVGESRVKGIDDACFAIANYTVYRLDRDYPNNHNQNPISYANAGGLLVYVHNDVPVDEWVSRNNPDGLQYIRLSLNFNNQQICLVAVYNPPVGGHESAMVRVDQQRNPTGGLLYDLRNIQQKVVVLGDINVDILGDENQDYQDDFGRVGFQQHVGR